MKDERFRFLSVGGRANGFIAIGTQATGVIAIGIVAHGVVAVGFAAFGVVSLGFLSGAAIASVGFIAVAPISVGPMACSLIPWTPPHGWPVLDHPMLGLVYWFLYVVGAVGADGLDAPAVDPLPEGWVRAVGRGGKVHLEDGTAIEPLQPAPRGSLLVRLEPAPPPEAASYREAPTASLRIAELRAIRSPRPWSSPTALRRWFAQAGLFFAVITFLVATVRSIVWLFGSLVAWLVR